MRYFMVIILLTAAVTANAISNYSMWFLTLEPSSINRGIGGDVIGSVNIWHNSPLTAYANPAVNAFREGVAFGFTRVPYKIPDLGIDYVYHASLASFGYKGISLLIPNLNANLQVGITLDSGLQELTDSQGNLIGQTETWDNAIVGGVAINPIEFVRFITNDQYPILNYFDLAYGVNSIYLDSYLGPGTGLTETDATAQEWVNSIGSIARASYCYKNLVEVEAVYGLVHFNPQLKEVTYTGVEQSDPIWNHRNQGFAISGSIKAEGVIEEILTGGIIPSELIFCENLLSGRYLYSALDPMYNHREVIKANGMELGLLDTFFLRQGYYEDKAGGISGGTIGYGINLHYKNLVRLSYNWARIPTALLRDHENSYDLNLNFDLLKMTNMLLK